VPRTLRALDAGIVGCRRCPRLIDWCAEVAQVKRAAYRGEDYWGGPVPGFGVARPRIWIVGLAPAAHGANRTGRMFTGDRSGDWLFAALHRAGLAATPTSLHRGDGQRVQHLRITAAVHCAPPGNTPTVQEQAACSEWLDAELRIVEPSVRAVLALGGLAWKATLAAMRREEWTVAPGAFGHQSQVQVRSPRGRDVAVIGSYHPSQQNTFTGRLTEPMLDAVMTQVRCSAGLQAD
jgi:uracil-DNA glycosylase family 4